MKTFAVLNGNTVINIIQGESLEDVSFVGSVVEYTEENPAVIGLPYDSETGLFAQAVYNNLEELTD
jgi:hypothetical protein